MVGGKNDEGIPEPDVEKDESYRANRSGLVDVGKINPNSTSKLNTVVVNDSYRSVDLSWLPSFLDIASLGPRRPQAL